MAPEDPEEPPGAVSDQNAEEAESEHGDGEGARRRPPEDEPDRTGEDDGGAAGEGSQSTGQPGGAG